MKKDVIYVDIEDDITSIIEKVKSAQTQIVALVPPKRIGVLQSVVNLKLLQRAATSADKRVVLITNDPALSSLAAGVSIPIARNLQSKPEVPEITALEVDDEDIINGDELPIGELAALAPLADTKKADTKKPFVSPLRKPGAGTPPSAAAAAAANAPKKGTKLPDFNRFRKRLFIAVAAGILLIAFLIWALVFAPRATVAITANTNLLNVDQILQLRPNTTADTAQSIIPVIVKQTKKTASVDFDATGKKDVGDKATGTVKFSTNNISNLGTTIPAGTTLTSASGLTFTTNSSVTITITNYQGATAPVTATDRGAKFNGATGSVSGTPNGISAALTAETAGGTDKTVTVVAQADIDKAKQQLQTQDANAIKTELKKQFATDMVVIEESFKADASDPVSSPVLDQEATKAKLTSETMYTLVGIQRTDLKANFDAYLKQQLAGKQNQKIYESGDKTATFSQFAIIDGGYSVKATAQAQVGPQIDEQALKTQLAGKRAGEIQQQLETINGIEDVQTSFFPFWVTKAPAADKITVKFVLKNEQ